MSPGETPAYGRSVAFLVSQVGARSAQLFAARLVEVGITPRAFGVLSHLDQDAARNQQQVADALGIHRNNMVGLIDDLESRGLVRRRRSTADRRAYNVTLTPDGREVVQAAQRIVTTLDDELIAGLDDDDQDRLLLLLTHVAQTMDLIAAVHPRLAE